ncbi:MAG: hypothetical protein LJE70_00250 [Chromatiaceae bacterium]|jgi:hypothetical protein|nr:hypothetical protein [Chromatiaceae bacterium]
MGEGYLVIETHAEHPGLVRILAAKANPGESELRGGADPRVRYVARFDDLDAAQMHVHARLKRRLVDVDTRLYRADAIASVAAAQSLALRHRQIYLDPELARDPKLKQAIERHRRQHRAADRFWQLVGAAAVIFLLLKLLLGI